MAIGNVFTATLTNNDPGFTGATRRQVFPVGSLNAPDNTPTQIRVKFNAASNEGYTIGSAYVGHKASSGDAYDFAATPVQLTFSSSPSVVIPSGQSAWSDWVNFSWNKTSDIIISEQCGGSSSSDSCRSINGTAIGNYYKFGALDAATVNASGYSTSGIGTLDLISEIEMDGFGEEYQPDVVTCGNNSTSISRQVNNAVALSYQETEVPDFRISVFTDAAAVADIDFQGDIVHNSLSGYTGVLACGCVLVMREGVSQAAMEAATKQIIQRGITGGNIYDATGHYLTLRRRAKIALQANKYYQFGIDLLATRPANTVSGQASLLVEGGNGLNSYLVTVNKNETLTSQ